MSEVVLFAVIFLLGEGVAYFVFLIVKRVFDEMWEWRIDLQVIKGWLERLFLFLCLAYDFPHALIAFGAIKIGTRVNDKENRVSNDYFFVGNMASLILVIFYHAIWRCLKG